MRLLDLIKNRMLSGAIVLSCLGLFFVAHTINTATAPGRVRRAPAHSSRPIRFPRPALSPRHGSSHIPENRFPSLPKPPAVSRVWPCRKDSSFTRAMWWPNSTLQNIAPNSMNRRRSLPSWTPTSNSPNGNCNEPPISLRTARRPWWKWSSSAVTLLRPTHREAAAAEIDRVRVQLGRTNITSPIDGTVTTRFSRQCEVIQPGSPIATIANLSRTRIEAEVNEFDGAEPCSRSARLRHRRGFPRRSLARHRGGSAPGGRHPATPPSRPRPAHRQRRHPR